MTATRTILLAAALAPYLALVSFDGWMHERDRRVPRLEQFLHWGAAGLFFAFIVAVFRGESVVALVLLAVLAGITAWDEVGFHASLGRRERRVHFASYGAFSLFLLAWYFVENRG
jgi:hypothetical protein